MSRFFMVHCVEIISFLKKLTSPLMTTVIWCCFFNLSWA